MKRIRHIIFSILLINSSFAQVSDSINMRLNIHYDNFLKEVTVSFTKDSVFVTYSSKTEFKSARRGITAIEREFYNDLILGMNKRFVSNFHESDFEYDRLYSRHGTWQLRYFCKECGYSPKSIRKYKLFHYKNIVHIRRIIKENKQIRSLISRSILLLGN